MRGAAAILAGHGAEFLLVALLLLAPLPNGCLEEGPGDARWQTLMNAALFLILLLVVLEITLLRRPFRTPRVWLPLAALFAFIMLQLLPLPLAVVKTISPSAAEWVLLAAGTAPDFATLSLSPQLTLLEGLRLAAYLSALFVVVNRFRTMRDCIRLAAWIVVACSAMAVLAFVHEAVADRTADRFTLLGIWKLERWGAPLGSYINRNHFAGLMEMGIAVALALILRGARQQLEGTDGLGLGARLSLLLGQGAVRVIPPFLGFAVMLAGLVTSKSRGGWLSMTIAVGLFLFWAAKIKGIRSAWKFGALLVLVTVLVVLFLGPAEFEHRLQLQGRAVDNRALIWQDCVFRMFPEFPITGAGAGTFLYSFQPYHSVPDKRLATHAESDWMQTLTGVGLIGVLLLLWAAVRFVRAMKAGLEGEVTPDRVFLGAALTGVLSLVLHGFVDVNLQIPANGMYFAILSGLCLAVARQQGGRGVLHWIDGSAGRLRQEEVDT